MNKKDFEIGSENIFADLGLPNPEEHLVKANLAIAINDIIKQRKLNQKDAATLLGIDQPKISALHQGKLQGFSIERLFNFLVMLGRVIDIRVSPKKKTKKESNNITVSMPKIKSAQSSFRKPQSAMLAKKKIKSENYSPLVMMAFEEKRFRSSLRGPQAPAVVLRTMAGRLWQSRHSGKTPLKNTFLQLTLDHRSLSTIAVLRTTRNFALFPGLLRRLAKTLGVWYYKYILLPYHST